VVAVTAVRAPGAGSRRLVRRSPVVRLLDLARREWRMIVGVDGLMTIGEFAARCRLSAKVLRTYAEVGLLVPSAVEAKTGYRYYAPGAAGRGRVGGPAARGRRLGVPVSLGTGQNLNRFESERTTRRGLPRGSLRGRP